VLVQVWLRNQGLFRSLVRKMLFESNSVEDVLHDAFVQVLRSKRKFSSERDAFNYLRKTVINATIDQYRRLKRSCNVVDCYPIPPVIDASEDPLSTMIREEAEAQQLELLSLLERLVQELSPEQRSAIDLFFGQSPEKKLKTICQESGIPYSTLRGRLSSAISRLRSRLGKAAPRPGLKKVKQA
jgi:RNA polymerase sigma factor (sigma-70 family)